MSEDVFHTLDNAMTRAVSDSLAFEREKPLSGAFLSNSHIYSHFPNQSIFSFYTFSLFLFTFHRKIPILQRETLISKPHIMEEILLPPRMFAAGDEPLGERVNSYHKINTTKRILAALEPDELEFLRNSTFGKILSIEENPPFSGAFGQYVVVRILKVNKKYEFWFLFAGNPVRMSLREFAIVTGLNCDKIPVKKKSKNPLKEKLYWNELFGSLKSCTVETAIGMLKDKVVKSPEGRLKLACLAITSSILFASSHHPRIIPEHVELIRDLDTFLAFPWGRASYQTLAASLYGKDEIALSQVSVAIRGYVEAIQLVLLAAIPQLKEEVTQSERVVIVDSESEGETPDAEDTTTEDDNAGDQEKLNQATKYCLIPGHAKSIDIECQVTSNFTDTQMISDQINA